MLSITTTLSSIVNTINPKVKKELSCKATLTLAFVKPLIVKTLLGIVAT